MPLVYQQNINESTKLAVWHIAEAESFFLQKVSLQNEITHPHKRLQHFAGRYLLVEMFDGFPLELIKIADTKKPFLPDEAYHFSISHCGDYAAAIVSTVNRVGIDIEIPQQKIENIKDKYLNEDEQSMLSVLDIPVRQSLTLAWSIKETMFKWYGAGGVDFRKHMHIDALSFDENEFAAKCTFHKNEPVSLKVKGLFFNGNFLTWVVTG